MSDDESKKVEEKSTAVPPIRRRRTAAAAPSEGQALLFPAVDAESKAVDDGWDDVSPEGSTSPEGAPAEARHADAPTAAIAKGVAGAVSSPVVSAASPRPVVAAQPGAVSPSTAASTASVSMIAPGARSRNEGPSGERSTDASRRGGEQRTHDVRAPRVSRSTKDSPQFRDVPASEPRRDRGPMQSHSGARPRRDDSRPNEGSSSAARPEHREARPDQSDRRPASPNGGAPVQTDARLGPVTREQRRPRPPEEPMGVESRPRRRDDERRPSDARPSDAGRREPRREVKRDVETPRERPVVTSAPQAPVVATRTASAPAEELSVIGARPVSEKKKPKEKDKPKTAKEALRARAEQLRAQRPAKKASKNDKRDRGGAAEAEGEANVGSSTNRTAREESRPKERKVREESVAEPVAKKGVWQRIKGLFGGG